ncbi:HotDog domain-containing protein [Podospora conica]|nr:HotDog domain-containing protein [Schizothecium conicum]
MPNDSEPSAQKIQAPYGHDLDLLGGEARLRELLKLMVDRVEQEPDFKEWTTSLLPTLKLLSTNPSLPSPSLVFEFTPTSAHLNGLQNMHGGAIASLFDFCTSSVLALVSRPGHYHFWGVSRTLSTSYLRPIPEGTKLLVECEAVAVGRQMAHLRGVLRGAEGKGVVYAVCEHGKVNVDKQVMDAMEVGKGKL